MQQDHRDSKVMRNKEQPPRLAENNSTLLKNKDHILKNYIAENRNKAIHELHPPAMKEQSNAADHHRNFGKVPN